MCKNNGIKIKISWEILGDPKLFLRERDEEGKDFKSLVVAKMASRPWYLWGKERCIMDI